MGAARSTRARRRVRAPLAGIVALALLVGAAVGGCSSGALPSAAPEPAATVPTADCLAPQVLAALGLGQAATPAPDAPSPGAVPDGFVATSVLACADGGELLDSSGTWTSVRASRLEGDVAALVVALRLPSARAKAAASCPAEAAAAPQVWLVDALGTAVRPELPTDGCGRVRAEVRHAVDRLEATDVVSYPVALVTPSAPAG
ncbi:hypothetical protein [Cellulomonas massiliensis]|uniref:hypothetical protein n=1 Tax=Cellulomonas massiliensis TaxID=1465811 RepID=UPI0003136899|nr:hypothetical protein [Cellulomonas massiliensis]